MRTDKYHYGCFVKPKTEISLEERLRLKKLQEKQQVDRFYKSKAWKRLRTKTWIRGK